MAGRDGPTAADLERQRRAAALNHLLGEIGLSRPDDGPKWWNLVQHLALGKRTATQVWLAGETEAGRDLGERWVIRTASDRRPRPRRGPPARRARPLRGLIRSEPAEVAPGVIVKSCG
jgi:hypothetical protein